MRIDLGLISAIIIEYIVFIYYADTLFYRKRNKYVCCALIAAGYILHFAVCIFGNVFLNTAAAVVIQIACFMLCYHISVKNAVFQSFLLTAINMGAESAAAFMPYAGIVPGDVVSMTPAQSLMLTVSSKLMYLIGIMVLSRVFSGGKKNMQSVFCRGLLAIPILTVIVMLLLIYYINITSNVLSMTCLIFVAMNIIVFAVNRKMIAAEAEIEEVKRQRLNEKIDYDEYMMLKEAQAETAVLNHDIREHIEALGSLIGEDNEAAKEYIRSVSDRIEGSRFIEYSDNKLLNIILAKKKEECREKGIKFSIDPIRARLDFLSGMDTVAIFSNLLQSCTA